jgi:hypothetical protein
MTAKKGKRSTSWQARLSASQAGENRQTNGFEHKMEFSILTELIFRETAEEE